MNRNQPKKAFKKWLRAASFFTLTAFTFTSFGTPLPSARAEIKTAGKESFPPLTSGLLKIPENIGTLEESFQGKGGRFVILLQDAHAIPDAQKNAADIIAYLQKEYGVNKIAVEGASDIFDVQFLKSFPDKERLKKVLNEYLTRGELTGAGLAAVSNKTSAVFQGIEDWKLYEKANELFLAALNSQEESLNEIEKLKKELTARKEKIYSPELLKLDFELNAFEEKQDGFIELLQMMFKLKRPEAGTELEVLFDHLSRTEKEDRSLMSEVRGKAEEVRQLLENGSPIEVFGDDKSEKIQDDRGGRNLSEFHEQFQNFQVSAVSAREFAVWLMDFSADKNIPVHFSEDWKMMQNDELKVKNLGGSKIFEEFESYAAVIKEKLFRSDAERKLDRETTRLQMAERMAKLELSPKDWIKVKEEVRGQKTKSDPRPLTSLLKSHFEFYENSEKRDEVFFGKLKELSGAKNSLSPESRVLNPVLFMSGGFHTQGLKERLKAEGISYAVVRPQIKNIPGKEIYLKQMRGDVSWKQYFKSENGKVNLYQSFMRGMRDALLKSEVRGQRPKTGSQKSEVRGQKFEMDFPTPDSRLPT